MASNINTTNIDTEYPEAGKDNSTQGFRDNFDSIKNNLDTAKDELEDLQENVARTDETTNFNENIILNASVLGITEEVFDIGNSLENKVIDFTNGHFQTITTGNSISLVTSGWPESGKLAQIRVAIKNDDGDPKTITWETGPDQTIKYDGNWPQVFTVSSSDDDIIVDLFSDNSGETIYAVYHGLFSNSFTNATEIRNLQVTGNATIEGDLDVLGSIEFPDLEVPVDLSALGDVSISSVADYQALKYDPETEQWQNQDLEPIEFIEVVVNDDDSGNQDIFYLDQTKLTDIVDLTLDVGKIYRFDISDPSNVPAALRFSTTPDTNVPDSITEYDNDVIINGTAGEEGAYVQIKITEDTPNPLYLFGVENPLDTSGIGGGADGAIKVGIKRKSGVFNELKGTLTGSVLADDETEIINSSDGKVVGQVEPSGFVLPSLTQSERDELDLVTGTMVFNTDTNKAQIYIDPAGWSDLN